MIIIFAWGQLSQTMFDSGEESNTMLLVWYLNMSHLSRWMCLTSTSAAVLWVFARWSVMTWMRKETEGFTRTWNLQRVIIAHFEEKHNVVELLWGCFCCFLLLFFVCCFFLFSYWSFFFFSLLNFLNKFLFKIKSRKVNLSLCQFYQQIIGQNPKCNNLLLSCYDLSSFVTVLRLVHVMNIMIQLGA